MKALSQATWAELTRAGPVRGDTLHGHVDDYVLSVQYGLHEAVLTIKRGGARGFARIDAAFALRILRAPAVEVRLADAARPATAWLPPEPAAMPPSIRRAKDRAAALLDALEVGETWDAHDAERAFNFERHLAARTPRGLRAQLLQIERDMRDTSPTFKRFHRSLGLPRVR